MIDPKTIGVTKEHDELARATRVRVGLIMQGIEFVSSRDPQEEDEAARRLQVQAWDSIYGDIESKLEEVRRRILFNVGIQPGGHEQVNAAINEVAAMVRNPFMS